MYKLHTLPLCSLIFWRWHQPALPLAYSFLHIYLYDTHIYLYDAYISTRGCVRSFKLICINIWHMHKNIWYIHIYMRVCACTYHIYTHKHIWGYVRIYLSICIYIHINIYTYLYISLYISICIYTYISLYMLIIYSALLPCDFLGRKYILICIHILMFIWT